MAARRLVSFCCVATAWVSLMVGGCASPSGPGFLPGKVGLPTTRLWTQGRFASDRPDMPSTANQLKKPTSLYLKYAQWQEEIGQLVEARQSYEIVLGQNPKSVDAILGLARLDHLAGRTQNAEQRYMKALKLNPGDPAVLDAVGQYYAAEERWNRAIDVLQSAVKSAPDQPVYRYHLAVALARSGQIDKAKPHFVHSVGEGQADYNIGYILYEQGQLAAAEQRFQRALRKNPQLNQAQMMLNKLSGHQDDPSLMAAESGARSASSSSAGSSVSPSDEAKVQANSSRSVHQMAKTTRSRRHRPNKPSMTANEPGVARSNEFSFGRTAFDSADHTTGPHRGTRRAQPLSAVPGDRWADASPPPSRLVGPHSSHATVQQREQWKNQRTLDKTD